MLIISVIKDIPVSKNLAITRAVYIIPGMICAAVLASSGVNITMISTDTTIVDLNSTQTWQETDSHFIQLLNPVWILVHGMIFVVLLFYEVIQILTLLTKIE